MYNAYTACGDLLGCLGFSAECLTIKYQLERSQIVLFENDNHVVYFTE